MQKEEVVISYVDHLKDTRVECYSVLLNIQIKDYLVFIEDVYKNKGGIEGQRSPLKTKSAQRIRKRLIEDLTRGTVIPPIVLGLNLSNKQFETLEEEISSKVIPLLKEVNIEEQISIIDGMQRTTALFEAKQSNTLDLNRKIRLELWISKSTNSLIYRMLVLNSGQIPWNIKRQIEVVFSQLKKELESNVAGLELFTSDEATSRTKGGQYQASQFIELFMLFGAKRVNIDIQEELAEEFARLDIIETSGNEEFTKMFFGVSQLLVNLDQAFSELNTNPTDIELNKFKSGKNIFSSQPARAGLVVALSQEIFGLPGVEFSKDEQKKKFDRVKLNISTFIKSLSGITQNELFELIDLPTLDEQLNVRTSKVGEFERNFFLKSFKTLIELANTNQLQTLTPCWRSSH